MKKHKHVYRKVCMICYANAIRTDERERILKQKMKGG